MVADNDINPNVFRQSRDCVKRYGDLIDIPLWLRGYCMVCISVISRFGEIEDLPAGNAR